MLRRQLHETPGSRITVDLDAQFVEGQDGRRFVFEIDASRKLRLVRGLNDTALALEYLANIEAFESLDLATSPWAAARGGGT